MSKLPFKATVEGIEFTFEKRYHRAGQYNLCGTDFIGDNYNYRSRRVGVCPHRAETFRVDEWASSEAAIRQVGYLTAQAEEDADREALKKELGEGHSVGFDSYHGTYRVRFEGLSRQQAIAVHKAAKAIKGRKGDT